MQKNGTLREMRGDIFRARRKIATTEAKVSEWCGRVKSILRSKKPTVRDMTFAQLEARFARDNNWQYPPRSWPMMPTDPADWYRPIRDVTNMTERTHQEMAAATAEGW